MKPASLIATLLCAALLVGCSDEEPGAESPTSTSASEPTGTGSESVTSVGPTPVQFREVRASGNSEASSTKLGELRDEFTDLDCESAPPPTRVPAQEPQVSCDSQQVRYLLEPAALETAVESAKVAVDESGNPLVTLTLDAEAADGLADVTTELADSRTKLAVVVNGSVVTAPMVVAPIENGVLQIAGGFTETEADELVKRLTAGE